MQKDAEKGGLMFYVRIEDIIMLISNQLKVTSLELLAVITSVVVFFITYHVIRYKHRNLPPGPYGWPIIGCLLKIKKDPHLKLQEMADKYGDVFSMYVGSRFVVVLNGVDAIKEGMNKTEFLGRPSRGAFSLGNNQSNIVSLSGKHFHEQRKFVLHSLHDLGLGKTMLEECMKVEIEHFLKELEDTKGQPYDVRTTLIPSVSNNITALVYGERYDYKDSRRKLLDNVMKTIEDFIAQNALHVFFPWITRVPFVKDYFGYDRVHIAIMRSLTFTRNRIDEHKNTLDPNHTRDYIDKFLLEMQRDQEKNAPDTSFTEEMLIGNIGSLLGAGSETVRTTLSWCFLLMAVYQEVQRKVQEEISSVVGSERMPAYSDQRQMPYTQSVIMEIMRHRTAVAINLLRCALEDTQFRGYNIPKNTIILANLWSAHYDKRHWKEPEKFIPERFINEELSVVKPETFMPFSVGKRSCPGESLAVIEVFLYFTAILQRFHIHLPEGVSPDLEGVLKITYHPKPQDLCFVLRSAN